MDPQRLLLDAGDMTFGALAWGDRDAPLAMLIHGYPDSAWTWRHLGPYLAERGWRAVAPFTRGYAPTAIPPDGDYSLLARANDLIALIDAFGHGTPSRFEFTFKYRIEGAAVTGAMS